MTGTVNAHSSCDGRRSAPRLCPTCLHWDPRPEDGSGPGMGYCQKKDIVTAIRCKCDYYEQATPSKVEARNRELYGQIDEDDDEDEDH